jgi:hypothetical protein
LDNLETLMRGALFMRPITRPLMTCLIAFVSTPNQGARAAFKIHVGPDGTIHDHAKLSSESGMTSGPANVRATSLLLGMCRKDFLSKSFEPT